MKELWKNNECEWYWNTEEYKTWLQLAHQNNDNDQNKKPGYWYYDDIEMKWKYTYL